MSLNASFLSGSIRSIVAALLQWFDRKRQDLPWRIRPNPYSVWISEVMLQQTVIKTVVLYFTNWMLKYPDLKTLATADENEVLRQWEGLGYYSRARNILRASKVILAMHGGNLPDSYEALVALPGIGDYTACAILSIGFELPFPVVDANVRRIAMRIHAWRRWSRQKDALLRNHLSSIIPKDRPGDFNEALMELGQSLCLPSKPLCSECPLNSVCRSYHRGIQTQIPQKRKRAFIEKHTLLLIVLRGIRMCVVQKTSKLLSGLWVFPGFDALKSKGDPIGNLPTDLASLLTYSYSLPSRTHHYTRFKDRLYPAVFTVRSEVPSKTLLALLGEGKSLCTAKWVTPSELTALPMPSAYRGVSRDLLNSFT
jgi:A/G-specific adenine glycosylase